MAHSSPNMVQVALLYDRTDPVDLNALRAAFLTSEMNGAGCTYNVVEAGPSYFRLFGGRDSDVMVFVEWVDRPTARANFTAALESVFNQIAAPDAEALIDRHRALLLINVHHGAMPQSSEIQDLLAKMGVGDMLRAGQSLPQYQERLRVMGLLAAMAVEISKPTLSHWTHTDVLVKPPAIKHYSPTPNPLNVHPRPYRGPGTTQDQGIAGLVTFGAAAYIEREMRVRPTEVPWGVAYEHALGFIALAILKNGYVIPDGDTFGDDSASFCYRVHHTAEPFFNGDQKIPCYELEPLLNKQHGFQSPGYIPRDRIVNIDAPQPEYVQLKGRAGREVVAEWKAKREMAERAGGKFEVKAEPGASVGGGFGKRQSGNGAAGGSGGAATGWIAKTFGKRSS